MLTNNDNLDDYSKLIMEFDLETEDKASKFLKCYLCHKIMINACNGPCGCLYCFECIINYLVDNHEICPRDDSQCRRVKLNSDNLRINSKINERISKLQVKCPRNFCEFKCELREMNNHYRTCEDKIFKCPFYKIGCKSNSINNTDEHMINEIYTHSNLLLEFIFNLKNENLLLTETIGKLKKEIDAFKTDVEQINHKINEIQIKNEAKLVSEDKVRESIDDLMKNCEYLNKESIESKQNLLKKFTQLELENKTITYEMNQNRLEFVWIINNWSDKLKQSISGVKSCFDSDPFYTHKHGYKICLRVSPTGPKSGMGSHLSILYCVMRGEYDDILPWPCQFDVKLELFDQELGLVHTSKIIKYDSNPNVETHRKPIGEINIGRGFQNFISINDIRINKGITKNDKIIIRCLITSQK